MKLRSLKNILISSFFIAALCFLVSFAVPNATVAKAAEYGSLTVTYDGEKYVCSDDEGVIYSNASLQNVIDYAESAYSQTSFDFDSLSVNEPLVFKGDSLLLGTLYFELAPNQYAITVNARAKLVLQGLIVDCNRGAVRVGYNGYIEVRSATIRVIGCSSTCSVIDVGGNALISGGEIIYSNDNGAFGYGISVNSGGKLTVTPEEGVPVKIEGHSAMCMSAGSAEINGGEFKANRTSGNSSAGYSVDIWDGQLTINDGVFPNPVYDRATASAKISINGGVSTVRMTPNSNQNKKLNINSMQVSAGNYCELNIAINFTANTVTIEGKKSSQGFKTVGYTVSGTKVEEPTLTISTDQVKTIIPIEDNHYAVRLACDGTVYETLSYAYGSTVRLSSLPAPEKEGYTLSGWEGKIGDFTINNDTTLNAVTVLADTAIEIAGTELTYNGTQQTITPVLTHALPVSYTTYWEKLAESGWVKLSDGDELNLTNVAESGQYRFVAIASYGDDESRTEKEVNITINKGRYENITHPEFSDVYDPEKRLSGYVLNTDFAWKDVTVIPTVPIKQYPAIYNADSANYEDCELFITIDLEKATGVAAPPHADLSGIYEKKRLEDYPLEEGFRWQSPEQIPVVKTTAYAAIYNPDTDNYEDTVRYITLKLEKGFYDESKQLEDKTVTYRPNYFLSDFSDELASVHVHYRLKYSSNDRLNAGTVELECIYNDDSDNYNDYIFTIMLTVEKADIAPSDVPQIPSFTGVYSGLPLSTYTLSENVFWRNSDIVPTVDVQEYEAFYNPDRENYNDYPIIVSLVLQKGTYDDESITVPILDAITYRHERKLSEIALPAGWYWTNPNAEPTVAINSYAAEYCADTVNYMPYATVITLIVNKADIPAAVLPNKTVTYDGATHYLEFEYLPYPLEFVEFENNGKVNAGKYEITAILSQTDKDNYNLHPTTVRGTLIILKAPSIINAPTRYDILEGNSVSITGTVENSEQNLVIPQFSETAVGVYHVTLTTAESSNYLAGSLTVTISINKSEKYIGNIKYPTSYDGSYLYGILINSDCGVPNDAEITFRPFPCEDYFCGIEISVTVDGKAYTGNFTAKIRMTDDMLSASTLKLFSEDGTEVAFTVENGVYLVFETDGSDVVYLQAEFDKKFAWYWIPIGIAIGLIVIGVVLVVLYKKGIIKLPKKATPDDTEASFNKSVVDDNDKAEKTDETVTEEISETTEEPITEEIKEQESEENIQT